MGIDDYMFCERYSHLQLIIRDARVLFNKAMKFVDQRGFARVSNIYVCFI